MASEGSTTGQPHLHKQDLSKLDISKLTALSPEVISRQATINIGTIGHVAHGKSTVVKAISGVQTVRFKNELERNITIKLGNEMDGRTSRKKRKRQGLKIITKKKKLKAEDSTLTPATPEELEEGIWEVEEIVDLSLVGGIKKFLVKWKDWGPEYNSWEAFSNVITCQEAIIEFFRKNKKCERIKGVLFGKVTENVEEVLSREQQLLVLQEFEQEVNKQAPHEAPITVENVFDRDVPPANFTYVSSYIEGPNVVLPDDPPIGCVCSTCGPHSQCCYSQNDAQFAYDKKKRLVVPPGTPIYECNKKCQCGPTCPNRVVQQGRKVALSIYKTSNGCGWGVKAKQFIEKGTFICEYVGEVLYSDEAEIRGIKYRADGSTYLFDLDFNDPDCLYTVDAAKFGNISHFINHSCDPNCAVYAVWINCLDPNIPCLALFALRDIQIEEQISFSYTSNNRLSKSISADLNASSDEIAPECKCGAKNCRKYLF